MSLVYETGRLNRPFVGIATIGKYPYVVDRDAIDAGVAVLRAPFGFGTQWLASEKAYVTGLSQFGNCNVSSTAKEGCDDARARGSDILSVCEIRAMGPLAAAERVPADADLSMTIDIDGVDPSIAAGTDAPSHGGTCDDEGPELMTQLAKRQRIVGIDLVEVAPDEDPAGTTRFLAAQ